MLSNVNNYNLVVYCDTDGYKYIEPYLKNPRIMAIIKPYKMFSTYKYKQRWMKNHEDNVLLNQRTDWRLNMLWSEKQNFVKETMDEGYFSSRNGASEGFTGTQHPPGASCVLRTLTKGAVKPRSSLDVVRADDLRSVCCAISTDDESGVYGTYGEERSSEPYDSEWYGWCDIGYFRGRPNDSPTIDLSNWPSNDKISSLDKNKIYYACVNNNVQYVSQLSRMIQDKNSMGLPRFSIPDNQVSIAGGFFIGTKENLEWWHTTYYSVLKKYFENGQLVKDDQIIVADGVFSNLGRFAIIKEEDAHYDNWFLFQRFLS
jgi:hypothetical protein